MAQLGKDRILVLSWVLFISPYPLKKMIYVVVMIVRVKRYTKCAIFAFIVILQKKIFGRQKRQVVIGWDGGWIRGMDKSTLGR